MQTVVPYIERTVVWTPSSISPSLCKQIESYTNDFYKLSKAVRPDATPVIKTPLAQKVNVAQLVIHIVFEDGSVVSVPILSKSTNGAKKTECFTGIFYLSGSEGIQIGLRPKQLFAGNFSSHCREIINNDKTILFIQREQPEYERLMHRFARLSNLENSFCPFGSLTQELLKIRDIAMNCQSQVKIIYERADICSIEMQRKLKSLQQSIPEPISMVSNNGQQALTLPFPDFSLISSNIGILEKMIECLQAKDFSFILLPKEYLFTYKDLIDKTSINLYRGANPKTIFNPRDCNFYCSEQLLLDEEFGNETRLVELSKLVRQEVSKTQKKIKGLSVQIDSTKFPCKVCTIDILQNTILNHGYIYKFFQLFPEIHDDNKIVTISYHEPYRK